MSILDIENLPGYAVARAWFNPDWRDDHIQVGESSNEPLMDFLNTLEDPNLNKDDLTYEQVRNYADWKNEELFPYLDSWVLSDLPPVDATRRIMGIDNNRTDESWISKMRYRDPDQFLGKELYDYDNFYKLASKGLLVKANGEPYTKQELFRSSKPIGSGRGKGGGREETGAYAEYKKNPENFVLVKNLEELLADAQTAEQIDNRLGKITDVDFWDKSPERAIVELFGAQFGAKSQIEFNPQNWSAEITDYFINNGLNPEDYGNSNISIGKFDGELYFSIPKDKTDIISLMENKEFMNSLRQFDPKRMNEIEQAMDPSSPYYIGSIDQLYDHTDSPLEVFLNSKIRQDYWRFTADEKDGMLYLPLKPKAEGGTKQYQDTITGQQQQVNPWQIISQPVGALLFETLPGIGMLSGMWQGSRGAVAAGSVVMKGNKAVADALNIPVNVAKQIEITTTGELTPKSVQILHKTIGKEATMDLQGGLRHDFATGIPQTNIASMSKSGNFDDVPDLVTYVNKTDSNPMQKPVTTDNSKWTLKFPQYMSEKELLETVPLSDNHIAALNSKPIQMSDLSTAQRNDMFNYVRTLVEKGYSFKKISEMDGIVPGILKGITSNKEHALTKHYKDWAKINGEDLYPEHTFHNRLAGDGQDWFISGTGGTGRVKVNTMGLNISNALVDTITNFVKTGDVAYLDTAGVSKFYIPSSQVEEVTKRTIFEINGKLAGRKVMGGQDKIVEYTAKVLSKSDDPDIIKFLGDDAEQAVRELLEQRNKYIRHEARMKEMYVLRELNHVDADMNTIHDALGVGLADGSYAINTPTAANEVLQEIMNATGLDVVQANKRLFQYISMHKGTFNVPKFDSRKINKNIGDLWDEFPDFYAKRGQGVDTSDMINNALSVGIFGKEGVYRSIKERIGGTSIYKGQGHPLFANATMDEIVARTTLARTGNELYGIFIQPLDLATNTSIKGGGTDAKLGEALGGLRTLTRDGVKFSEEEFNKILSHYTKLRKETLKDNPNIILPEPVYGTIPKEQMEYLTNRFGEDIANRFKKLSEKNGYHFKVDDKMLSMLDSQFEGYVQSSIKDLQDMASRQVNSFATGTRDGTLVGDPKSNVYNFSPVDFMLESAAAGERRENFYDLPESVQDKMSFLTLEDSRTKDMEEWRQNPSVRFEQIDPGIRNLDDIKTRVAEEMTESKPVKFKWSSLPKLITQNPLYRQMERKQQVPLILLGSIANDVKNKFTGDDKLFYENFPTLAKWISKSWSPIPPTDPEQEYIDGIVEFNRALDSGLTNLGYNSMDLILGGIDLTSFGKTDLSGKLRDLYESKARSEPETFLGDMISLLVEFGVPGGVISKIVMRAQKSLRLKGVNTMTRYIDDDTVGAARLAMQMSNVAKRMGTGALIFGATDFVGGGPYNSLHRMFPEDPTLLPGKPIDTKDLNGNELALANLKNRVRFAGDGAMIGGLFPLLGPPAWALTKGVAKLPFKTIPGIDRSIFGGALQLAGIPLKIAADTLAGKIPYTSKTIPLLGKGMQKFGQWSASGIQQSAAFLGKQVFARAALGAFDVAARKQALYSGIEIGSTFKRSLPPFKEWRKFSVNNQDPLHVYLAKLDNVLSGFRDIGKLGNDMFGLLTQRDLFIRAKSRTIDKFLTNIEQTAYKMAKTFEERHQKYGEFETIQKKYLDDVLDYLQGNIKLEAVPGKLKSTAKELKEYVNQLKNEFKGMLPKDDPLAMLLTADIDKYMRRSFSMFTNASYTPTKEAVLGAKNYIKDLIKGSNQLFQEATQYFPKLSVDDAIEEYAQLKVGDIMHTARYELDDPFKALENIINKKLGLKDIAIRTGEEVPNAIRKLLGEEKNLKSSLLQTTGNIISSTQQKQALDKIAKLGKEGGWLFDTAEEALAKGKIFNAWKLSDIKGAGFIPSDVLGMYGSPEIVRQLSGYSIFDSALKYKIYQNLLAFKAMVQGGKTLYSPATQMRNFGSASLFALNVGHIGGNASVTQSFKIVLDDIFGPGPKVNNNDLIKYIERKVELGVIDENVVANELAGILADLKGTRNAAGDPIISNFNGLLQKVGDTKLSQYVQRTYAGGDNVWKMYGHEFYMSELKQFTKSIDDVKKYFRDMIGREFVELSPKTGVKKTLAEGIEEMAAHLVRETYPTYSRVPPVIQALRKLPVGNFISFPAEMLRTSATTLGVSLKHIASGNPGLQAMGYRSLMGQYTTLYGLNEAVSQIASTVSGVSQDKMQAYLDDLGPDFMQGHKLVPLGPQDPQTGIIKAFDISTYNPYAYVTDPWEGFIREIGSSRLDPTKVDGEIYRRLFDAAGPIMALVEPFTSEAIALEPMFDVWMRGGVAKNGSRIFSPSDDPGTKISKSFNHILETIAPGIIRSTGQVWNALKLDTKSGRVADLGDTLIKLLGGSVIVVDPVQALDYKALDIREIRSNAFKTEHFFSKSNALERGPDVMAAEFDKIQQEALNDQYNIWKMFQNSLRTGLLTEDQIIEVLGKNGRNVPNLINLIDGYFTPVSYSKDGLLKRADSLVEEYKRNGIKVNWNDLYPVDKLEDVIDKYYDIRFEDIQDPSRPQIEQQQGPLLPMFTPTAGAEDVPAGPPLNAPTPVVSNQPITSPNPETGLTTTEEALLSPSEKVIQQRQRGMGNANTA